MKNKPTKNMTPDKTEANLKKEIEKWSHLQEGEDNITIKSGTLKLMELQAQLLGFQQGQKSQREKDIIEINTKDRKIWDLQNTILNMLKEAEQSSFKQKVKDIIGMKLKYWLRLNREYGTTQTKQMVKELQEILAQLDKIDGVEDGKK